MCLIQVWGRQRRERSEEWGRFPAVSGIWVGFNRWRFCRLDLGENHEDRSLEWSARGGLGGVTGRGFLKPRAWSRSSCRVPREEWHTVQFSGQLWISTQSCQWFIPLLFKSKAFSSDPNFILGLFWQISPTSSPGWVAIITSLLSLLPTFPHVPPSSSSLPLSLQTSFLVTGRIKP